MTPTHWHALPLADALRTLNSSEDGLTEAEARTRLRQHGPNRLPKAGEVRWWQILLRQFTNPLIYILGIAALVSISLGDTADAGFIAVVLLSNALIGGYQEWRAEKGARSLQKLLQARAIVHRNGEAREIDAEGVVPGDVVWLESGNRVPADLRLFSAQGLEVDESFLTGESVSVSKDVRWRGKPETGIGDRRNMAFAGAIVVRGRGKGLAVGTGTQTAVGQLAENMLSAPVGKTPLIVRMERFTHAVGITVLFACAVVAVAGVLLRGYGIGEMFMFGVALAVSAIPEGLPIAITVALAIATARMVKRGVIVRRLAAVEGLGSCTYIASDKTGTLTCNALTAKEIWLPADGAYEISGEGFEPAGRVHKNGKPIEPGGHEALHELARTAVLCNEASLHQRDGSWAWHGDPTDVALLSMGHKLGWIREATLDLHPQVNQIPFEPERMFSATYNNIDEHCRVLVKGAPERVLKMCHDADPEFASKARQVAEEMARRGFRVLGFAAGDVPADTANAINPPEPQKLTFLGFVGMIDPLRPGVKEAVHAAHAAGITVAMVTGDHPVTALAIARDLGLADSADQVIIGTDLASKTDEELKQIVGKVRVFARVAPEQKVKIVQAARAAGHFVAVTGDGVNDAPALRSANIGVAMGKGGTDVAREAAELVITDDNFATIVGGIEEGRVAYDNIRKVVYLQVSTGAAEIVLIALAVALGTPLPLLPVQLLWLNLVTNGIQDVALAFEPNEGGVLERGARSPQEHIFNWMMIERTVIAAVVMGVVAFGLFYVLIEQGMAESSARNALLLLMVLFENIHIGNCRSETKSAFVLSPFKSPILLAGALIAFLLHFISMHFPLGQRILQVEPVGMELWAILIALALSVLVVMEIHKLIRRSGNKKQAAPPQKTHIPSRA